MAVTAVRSGKHGTVEGDSGVYHQIRNWVLADSNTPQDRVSSATRGGHTRRLGVGDWTGSFVGFGGLPPLEVFPGENVNLQLFAGPTSGVFGDTGLKYYGPSIIDSLSITWDFTPGGDVQWTANFSANGCLATDTDDIVETPEQCVSRMCPLHIDVNDYCADDAVWTEWPNVKSMTLTFTADNQSYSNSSTNCCTYREAGNLDWILEVIDEDAAEYLVKDTAYRFRIYDTATTYWQVGFGLFHSMSDLNVDVFTGVIKSKTNTIAMNGQTCCLGSGSLETGSIINPDGVTLWPVVAI